MSLSQWVHPGTSTAPENRSRKFRNFDQSVNANDKSYDQRRQERESVGQREPANDCQQRQQHFGKNKNEGAGDNLVKAESDERLEPTPKQPIQFGHDKERNKNRAD